MKPFIRCLYKRGDKSQVGGDKKYFIQCSPDQLHSTEFKEWKEDTKRAIFTALLNHPSIHPHQEVVLKLQESETIMKEYQYAERLKDIHGFIRMICMIKCRDNPFHYSMPFKNKHVCKGTQQDPEVSILVMPYLSMGSFRKYTGWIKHPLKFRACFLQIAWSLYEAYIHHGFIHTDIHLDNILLKRTSKKEIRYAMSPIPIPTEGLSICIMDFGNSMMPVSQEKNIHFFWKDIHRIVSDMKYSMYLQFENMKTMDMFLAERSFYHPKLYSHFQTDFKTFIQWIESIQTLIENKPKPLVYSPFIEE
jgi:serine/threonine protein kinase